MFKNRFDDFVNIFYEKDVISCYQTRNAMNTKLSDIRRNRVAGYSKIEVKPLQKNRVIGYFKIEEKTLKRNRVVGHLKIEEGATKQNSIASHFNKREEIEGRNKNIFKVSFFN